uniref:Uncharacterized protein n=1 Tax=Avena sativa TaxID=4498 RepID=A0ACD5ZJ67_AVESA
MAGGGPLELWNHRSMQILVLLSLGLQLVLFVFAGTRRREGAPVRRLILWLAYLMADSTAVYALGHLSLSASVHDSQLVTFWGPFLLLHLGGPDNITAYALQDNQLWLRHLQMLVVQVLGAAYVLNKYYIPASTSDGGGHLLRLASFLMFGLGVVKYGERTWALKRSTLESIGVSVRTQPPAIHNHFHPHDEAASEEEFHVRRAHSLFHVCKRAIVDSSVIETDMIPEGHNEYTSKMMHKVDMWTLTGIELSLLYDLLYTKAAVVHTLFGYVVRVISPLTAAASLLLFLFTSKDGHGRADIVITYVLLAGAVFMETTSLVNALGSSWTFAFLSTTRWRWIRYSALCNQRWDRLRRAVVSLRHLFNGGGSRYKSARLSNTIIGQYNMLHFCTRAADGPFASPLLGSLAKKLGLNEWWNRNHYSGTTNLSSSTGHSIVTYLKRLHARGKWSITVRVGMKWGKDPLERRRVYVEGILKDSLGFEFQEGIIIWHIGTDVFLAKSESAKAHDATPTVDAIKVLSDYMMFLLVERPYMLPGQPQSKLYQRTCEKLVSMRSTSRVRLRYRIKNLFRVHDGPAGSSSSRAQEREELVNNLYHEYVNKEFSFGAPRLTHVARLSKHLLEKERDGTTETLELVLEVWMDILVYASNKCSRNSHAQKLNSGGEMTTIIWLIAEHLYRAAL